MLFVIWLIGFVIYTPVLIKEVTDVKKQEQNLSAEALARLAGYSEAKRKQILVGSAVLTGIFWPIALVVGAISILTRK